MTAPKHAGRRGKCELCGLHDYLTKHHLKPRPYRKKGERGKTVASCHRCHVVIHAMFTHRQLAQRFYTVQRLKNNFAFRAWIKWRKKVGVTPYGRDQDDK